MNNCMTFQPADPIDPFAELDAELEATPAPAIIHIRLQQRNARKTLTTVQGVPEEYDLKKLLKAVRKNFACNGCIIEHDEHGKVIQLQGDQRENVYEFLIKADIADAENLKVHGY
jgi:translation initiation factor 1